MQYVDNDKATYNVFVGCLDYQTYRRVNYVLHLPNPMYKVLHLPNPMCKASSYKNV